MPTRQCKCRCVLLILASGGALVNAQGEQWLQYRHSRASQEILRQLGNQNPELITTRPEGLDLPDLASGEPIFAKWATPMVKGGHVWLVLVRSNPNGIHNQLYIDSDGDGSLDDQEPVKAHRTNTHSSCFGPVKLLFESEDGPISYHLNLRYCREENYERLYVHAGGWYEGTVTVAGQPLHCVLVDQNANGAFDDRALDFSHADWISVGRKDDPQFRLMGKYLQIDDTLYEIEVARDGAFVVFSEARGVDYGEVHLPQGTTVLGAGGPLGQFDCVPEAGIIKLPVGEYRIEHWAMKRKDDEGHEWQVKGHTFEDKSMFQVSSVQKTELKVGEPLLAGLKVVRNGSRYSLSQELKGSLGERIEFLRNGSRPGAPKLRIINKTGSYERTINFEYG